MFDFWASVVCVKKYSFIILLFALGLMSKPMLVTLPFVLLLIDFWPLRRLYLASVRYFLNLKDPSNKILILYRLDQDNVFIRDKSNLSGLSTGLHQNKIDALSIQFYRHLEQSSQIKRIAIKQLPMYQLYTSSEIYISCSFSVATKLGRL